MTEDNVDIRIRIKDQARANAALKSVGVEAQKIGTKAERGATKATRATTKMQRGMGLLKKSAAIAALGVGAAFAAYRGAKSAVQTTVQLAKDTDKLSLTTGLSNRAASRWIELAKLRGIAAKQLGVGFVTLSKNVLQATTGGKKQAAMFKELGVSQEMLRRGDTGPILLKVADAMHAMHNPAKRAATVQTLFGRSGKELIPILSKGSKAIREQLGLMPSMSKSQVQAGKAFAVAWRMIQVQIENIKIAVGLALLPSLTKAADKVASFVDKTRKLFGRKDLTGEQKWSKFGDTIATAMETALPKIASKAGQLGGKMAVAFGKGFLHADTWGKLAMGAFLVSRLVGWQAIFRGAGKKGAGAFKRRFVPGMAVAGVEGGAATAGAEGLAGKMGMFRSVGRRAGKVFGAGLAVGILLAIPGIADQLKEPLAQLLDTLGIKKNPFDKKGTIGSLPESKYVPLSAAEKIAKFQKLLSGRGWHDLQYLGNKKMSGIDPKGKKQTRKVPGMAAGGILRTAGTAVVGEHGIEIASFPRGARVDPLPRPIRSVPSSLGSLASAGGPVELVLHNNTTIEVDGEVLARKVTKHKRLLATAVGAAVKDKRSRS